MLASSPIAGGTRAAPEAAAYRACRRCDPGGAQVALHAATARTTCALIEESEEAPPLAALAARAGYARHHFLRLFREVTGLTPYGYEAAVRVRRLSAALVAGERVVDAVTGAGFGGENPGSTQATRARWAWPLARSAVVAEAR